jgi:APA family basic amino acid/polyamine antiporter
VIVLALHRETGLVGAGWMLFGVLLYAGYRRRQQLPLTRTVKVVAPEPLGVEEVEYKSILVAFENEPFSEEAVATAARLAGRNRRGIHVHAIVNVPTALPMDAPLEREEEEAQSKIEQAKLIGGLRVTGHVERIRPGQSGYAIAEEAREIKAAAIVVGLRFRDSRPLYDDTLRTVLAERPCRVIVVSDPAVDGVSQPRRPLVSAT